MGRFVPDKPAIQHLLRSPDGMVADHFHVLSKRTVRLAKAQVGVDTGALKASISYTLRATGAPIVSRIGSKNKIAYLHHEGTSPHVIRPKKAQTLRFQSHGRIVYAKVVNHPGTKPNRYLTDSLAAVIG